MGRERTATPPGVRLGDALEPNVRDGDSETAAALISLAPAGVMTGHRVITMGDEYTLLSEEIDAFELSIPRVRRQSGAARLVARELLAASGLPKGPLPRARGGATHWPPGIVGSLAHDDEIAVAAIARAELFIGLGIDVEPSMPLPRELIERVATPGERKRYAGRVLESRVLFAAKEAVYKAQYASDEIFLEFHDIEVDLDLMRGVTSSGRNMEVRVATSPRIFALALIRVDDPR